MGDSILDLLSLPPSGRAPSNQPSGAKSSAADQSDCTQTRDKAPFIKPVIGLISNEDVPVMISASKRVLGGGEPASSKDETDPNESSQFTVVKPREKPSDGGVNEGEEQLEEERDASKRSRGVKRKQPDKRQRESDEEEEEENEVLYMTKLGKKRISSVRQSDEDGAARNDECNRAALATRMTQLGLHLPDDPSLCSIFASCLSSQPRVIIEKLPEASAGAERPGRGGNSFHKKQQNQRRKSPAKAPTHKNTRNQLQKSDSDISGLDDKE